MDVTSTPSHLMGARHLKKECQVGQPHEAHDVCSRLSRAYLYKWGSLVDYLVVQNTSRVSISRRQRILTSWLRRNADRLFLMLTAQLVSHEGHISGRSYAVDVSYVAVIHEDNTLCAGCVVRTRRIEIEVKP